MVGDARGGCDVCGAEAPQVIHWDSPTGHVSVAVTCEGLCDAAVEHLRDDNGRLTRELVLAFRMSAEKHTARLRAEHN